MHIEKYKIVQNKLNDITIEVNKLISQGWIPLGGAQPFQARTTGVHIEYSQTMVKYSYE